MEAEVRHYPPIDASRTRVPGPVSAVTLLEDRAQVRRVAKLSLANGKNQIAIEDVAPTLQDVSLTAELLTKEGARVTDVRCRRAMRVWHEDQPEPVAAIEAEIEALQRSLRHVTEDRARAESRHGALFDIVGKGVDEIPADASWGMINQQAWKDTFDTLFSRLHALRQEAFDLYHRQLDLNDALDNAVKRRITAATTSRRFVAWIEVDVWCETTMEAEVAVDYVVPNALWRPMHQARLTQGARVEVTSSAVIWQRTGEDWTDATLSFSTARSSLGTEPPLLSDDLVAAQRRSEQVIVEARQVEIQRARVEGAGGGGGAPAGRELPGVDDGGEIQLVVAEGEHTIPSDGRPAIVPLSHFVSECEARLVVVPELAQKAFLETLQINAGGRPLLAGPVELVKDHGFVGWTQTMFVAPGERFSLSFGPDDAVRVYRHAKEASEVDHVDGWRVKATLATVYLSNLGGDPKHVVVTERIPVSDVEEVRIALLQDETSPGFVVDDDGHVKWQVDLEPHGHEKKKLAWSMGVAPGVEGLAR